MSENKFRISVDVKDTELFQTMLTYTEALIGILSEYHLSESDERKLNEISGAFFQIEGRREL
ncbi:hypothetical protein [Neobacillus niacini]|uniref:hypothetical protein n=1 Tax=Neobacillus niacini TaxID=86668 RepID=UPI00285E238E|nr:hypothetical protein [Neobacillus niacini]MDR7001607.1 hypothetical protein [Neobacillus niacini]